MKTSEAQLAFIYMYNIQYNATIEIIINKFVNLNNNWINPN